MKRKNVFLLKNKEIIKTFFNNLCHVINFAIECTHGHFDREIDYLSFYYRYFILFYSFNFCLGVSLFTLYSLGPSNATIPG